MSIGTKNVPVIGFRNVPVRRLPREGSGATGAARAAHVKQTPMCAKPKFGRACRRLRMSFSGLWLLHGLRGGCAAPKPEAVAGATPFFRCLLWHLRRLGCALHPNPPRGSLRASDPMREGQTASRNRRVPALVGDAGQPGGQVVGQRVLQRLEATLDTLPGRTVGPERPPVEDGMGVSMPILPDGTPRVQGGGGAPVTAASSRVPRTLGSHSTTIKPPTTYETCECPVEGRVRVRTPPMSRGHSPYGPSDPVPGSHTRYGSACPEVAVGRDYLPELPDHTRQAADRPVSRRCCAMNGPNKRLSATVFHHRGG